MTTPQTGPVHGLVRGQCAPTPTTRARTNLTSASKSKFLGSMDWKPVASRAESTGSGCVGGPWQRGHEETEVT